MSYRGDCRKYKAVSEFCWVILLHQTLLKSCLYANKGSKIVNTAVTIVEPYSLCVSTELVFTKHLASLWEMVCFLKDCLARKPALGLNQNQRGTVGLLSPSFHSQGLWGIYIAKLLKTSLGFLSDAKWAMALCFHCNSALSLVDSCIELLLGGAGYKCFK